MKKLFVTLLCALTLSLTFAKGGGSSGGRGGGFSGGGRSVSSAPASRPSAAPAPAAPRGNVANAPTRTNTTTTSTTTQTSRVTSAPVAYGGMGMGYGYSNGILTGLIIGSMMHPHNTVVYNGGGYSGNALLYPDGRVVNQQGVHVGNYNNNQFSAVSNGQVIAQAAPVDAVQAQPVIIQKTGPSTSEVVLMILGGILCVFLILLILA